MVSGSSADAPTTPDLRASDEERERAVGELGAGFAAGRLSHETFVHRMNAAFAARSRGQLDRLLADLPPKAPGRLARMLGSVRNSGREIGSAAREVIESVASAARRQRTWALRIEAPGSAAPVPLHFPPGSARPFTIGRDRGCDLFVPDPTVSRLHARLEPVSAKDGWLLADLGSKNGTTLNGWRVREPVQVRAGDRVRFGAVTFVMHERAGQEGTKGMEGKDVKEGGLCLEMLHSCISVLIRWKRPVESCVRC
jgi:FHA domain/DUF1707 SHOCT-like domain